MKTFRTLSLIVAVLAVSFAGCKKSNEPAPAPAKPFVITDHFVAGTLTQKSGTKYTSVFFIQLLEDNKALFINSSSTNLVGTYTLSETELVFEVTGGNARIAKFTLDKDKKITSAYYKALITEYDATGELLTVKETNELAGKKFRGEEFKMGEVSNRPGLVYSFNKAGTTTYGSGIDGTTIDNADNNYALIGGNGFKYVNGSTVELGFVSNRKLTVFRSSGLFYYGKYDQQ
jgi:heat shock protein HslJ